MLTEQQILSNCDNNLGKNEIILNLISLVYSGKIINKEEIVKFIEQQQKTFYRTTAKNI